MKNNFFNELRAKGIKVSEAQEQEISRRLNSVLQYEPKIGIFGKTGVGKSSLCNALFGQDICPISDVQACTRSKQEVMLTIDSCGKGIKLIDVPGVGESTMRDEEYGQLYANLLPELDLVLWLIKADDRAYASDETFYKNIVLPHVEEGKPFFFVLNQVDKIEPYREWDVEKHQPGSKQFQNIHHKIDDMSTFFNIAASSIIPVSASEKYNLTKLVDEFVRALPDQKKITVFRAVDEEFKSAATGAHVKKSFIEVVGDIITTVTEVAGDVLSTVIETAGDIITTVVDIWSDAKDFVRGLFSFW